MFGLMLVFAMAVSRIDPPNGPDEEMGLPARGSVQQSVERR
jgi:hypothetical protein